MIFDITKMVEEIAMQAKAELVETESEIVDNKRKHNIERLIDELSKMPPKVIETAYLHAINYTFYGEDVTEKWVTATRNARALEKAYRQGYSAALQKMRTESEVNADAGSD